tara:strand:+ start:138 stop:611 length:474 start_codon:yes stop_codon:yes gene_type:complete
MANNYNKSIIYKLVDNETGDTYFGATQEPINRRISKHKNRQSCKCRDIIRKNDFEVVVLEEYDSDEITKNFLLGRERHYICHFNCVNKVVPLQTKKEYYEKNKTYLLKKARWWKLKEKCKPLLNSFIFRHLNKINMTKKQNPSFFNFVKITFPNNNI